MAAALSTLLSSPLTLLTSLPNSPALHPQEMNKNTGGVPIGAPRCRSDLRIRPRATLPHSSQRKSSRSIRHAAVLRVHPKPAFATSLLHAHQHFGPLKKLKEGIKRISKKPSLRNRYLWPSFLGVPAPHFPTPLPYINMPL